MNADPVSYQSAAALATTGRVVRFTAARIVNYATDPAAHNGFGILDSTASAADQGVSVTEFGDAWAEAGDTITPGTHFWLTWDAQSRVVPVSAGTDQVIGYFKGQRAAVVGQRILIFVIPSRAVA